jgi:hypothetical protein
MEKLLHHGRITCSNCFDCKFVEFDKTVRTDIGWRITANPLGWGNPDCEVVVLGFSKGPTQAGALANTPHDEIAYKGSRTNVGKILAHIGVMPTGVQGNPSQTVSRAIADKSGRFHFGSLIRCTVERFDEKTGTWKGSGGGMLDKFVASPLGKEVATNCSEKFLGNLPSKVKLVVMFGLGTKLNYVKQLFSLYRNARKGNWTWINDVAYTDGKIVVVHVEHFASLGALIPKWMGKDNDIRGQYGRMAQDAVKVVQY